ncbi:ATP-binding cassette domain-containing protein [Candidatus Kapabacteria bacterium]|nr:ATP-binding cassette domain-containing protein [Candidatus Kapabacteria bacterium]
MISAQNLSVQFGKRVLFKEVNIKFSPGNCYGIIGANGAGKSTFLKILSGEIEPTDGQIQVDHGKRIAVLKQDQFEYDEQRVLDTVIIGHKSLFKLSKEREELYAKTEFTEEEGIRMGEIEAEFAEMNGYEAESDAGTLLSGLGLNSEYLDKKMKDLESGEKVKVLLAQALFGNPDILLLDEPTNNLDIQSIEWLEDFLIKFNNTVIVVSHDRHFLDSVCTHIADIDFKQINTFVGNYSFWQEAVRLITRQKKDQQRKNEDKAKELRDFISRFSANASKAKQATSRKKMLDKLDLENMPHSSRRFPYIEFKPDRECGNIILNIENLSKTLNGEKLFSNFNLTVNPNDKIAFISENDLAISAFFDIINNELEADSGSFEWGVTISNSYFAKEHNKEFAMGLPIVEWLRQYSKDSEETYIRSFLGRMLFSQEEALKATNVLSGGEKVRCMLSKTMLSGANTLILDDPTNHLDLEAISSLNDALVKYSEVILLASHDHALLDSTANRIIELTPNGVIDKMMTYNEFLHDEDVKAKKQELLGLQSV